jgi:hypothetical protein
MYGQRSGLVGIDSELPFPFGSLIVATPAPACTHLHEGVSVGPAELDVTIRQDVTQGDDARHMCTRQHAAEVQPAHQRSSPSGRCGGMWPAVQKQAFHLRYARETHLLLKRHKTLSSSSGYIYLSCDSRANVSGGVDIW